MKSTALASALVYGWTVAAQGYGTPTDISCPAPGETSSDGQYGCNPAHQYPAGQTCQSVNGCPILVTASSTVLSTPAGDNGNGNGNVKTMYSTTLVTITSCPGGCSSECTESATAPTSHATALAGSGSSSAPSSKHCPAELSGAYQYPHLIVPVSSSEPTKAYGTSYNGTITATESSIFNFHIPASYAGKICSLVFLLPNKKDLKTSSYSFNGKGGLMITELSHPATEQTTYDTCPKPAGLSDTIGNVAPGNSYVVFSHECGAGQRVGFEFASIGGLELNFFQDYNPSPLGAYITAC